MGSEPSSDTIASQGIGRIWQLATSEGVPRCALGVALVVGTMLNLINQGDALLGGAPVDLVKVGLTYCVPYCVSTYGAVTARLGATGHAKDRC